MECAESANKAKKFADINGIPILTQWYKAFVNFDKAMQANQMTDVLGNFYVVVACIRLAQPYIINCKCREWFAEAHIECGKVARGLAIGTLSLPQANCKMIEQHNKFIKACGSCGPSC